MLVNLLSKGSLQVLLTSKAMLPSHVANLYISTPHPCRSVCDCSGVTSAAIVDVMNIFASLSLSAKTPNCWTLLSANSPVGLRCSLSSTNETL